VALIIFGLGGGLSMNVSFKDGLTGDGIENAMDRLEGKIRKKHPEVDRIFIEAESVRDMRRQKAQIFNCERFHKSVLNVSGGRGDICPLRHR
jgi:hypothetical protein